jgi:flagellar protein FliS
MLQTAYDNYLESRVESAEPLELVRMLYQGATGAVREARRCLAADDIAGRARQISKAFEILTELMSALDPERGGEIAERLGQLYDYMQRRLLEANARQVDEPLAEVLGLLTTLTEAWAEISRPEQPAAVPAAQPWMAMGGAEMEAEARAWSA